MGACRDRQHGRCQNVAQRKRKKPAEDRLGWSSVLVVIISIHEFREIRNTQINRLHHAEKHTVKQS
jgi:hypothetical protein